MIEENRTELSRDYYRFAPLSDVMTYGLNLSDGAYRTWAVLWRRQGHNGSTWTTNKTLAADRGVSQATVGRHLAELEGFGLIQRWETEREDGSKRRHVHVVLPGAKQDFAEDAERLGCTGPTFAKLTGATHSRAPRAHQRGAGLLTSEEPPCSPVSNRKKHTERDSEKDTPSLPPRGGSLFGEGPKPSKPKSGPLTSFEADLFEAWWSCYPKKVGKGAAKKAWRKARAHFDSLDAMLEATRAWAHAHRHTERKYIPNPATWLNGERWEDDLEAVEASREPDEVDPTEELLRSAERTRQRYGS